jgi:glutathione peroxidase
MKGILIITLFSVLNLFAAEVPDLKLKQVNGETLDLAKLKGKAVVYVNVATRCGYTGQLDDLEKLYQKYKSRGLVVVGMPSNDFGGQTPESNKEVGKFCRLKYGVTFPLLEKSSVKGPQKSKLAKVLTESGDEISWNFEKFVVDKKGKIVTRFKSGTEPLSSELTKAVERLL